MLEVGDLKRPDHFVYPGPAHLHCLILQTEGDIVAHSQVRKQGEVLEYHAHASLLHGDAVMRDC